MTSAPARNQSKATDRACRRHRMAELHAFSSIVGPDFRAGESNLDVLVESEPDESAPLYKTHFNTLIELRQTLTAPSDLEMLEAIHNPYAKVYRSFLNMSDHIGWGAFLTAFPLLAQRYAQLLHQLNLETS